MDQYQPLFLKYRPQSLTQLVGQKYVAVTLANAIKHNRLSHAYLFTGPRGTGKTSSARILARSLNCHEGPTAEPCQVCTSCVEIKQGNSPAVMEIDAASNNSVDDARLLIERAPLIAPGGRFKLYIIDECHMLTKEAFNALLKTIEEPPANVVFILATTEEHKVPQTIHSRCQRLMFRLISQAELVEHLSMIAQAESINIDPEAIELIARHSGGGLRDALGLLDQASLLSSDEHLVTVTDLLLLVGALDEDVLLSMSKSIIAKDGANTLLLANQLLNEGKEAHIIAAELAKHMLNLARASLASNSENGKLITRLVLGSPKYVASLIEIAKGMDRAELANMAEGLDRLEQTCKRSSQPALNLEIGLLSSCHRLDSQALKVLEGRIAQIELQVAKLKEEPTYQAVSNKSPKISTALTRSAENQSALDATTELAMSKSAKESGSASLNPASQQTIIAPFEQEPNSSAPHFEVVSLSESTTKLDEIWSDLLAELQKRHLPTFSLVSTHAFPLGLTNTELNIGVLVENFQRMIESKVEHITAVAQSITGRNLRVTVKTVEPRAPQTEKKRATPASQQQNSDRTERAGQPISAIDGGELSQSSKVDPLSIGSLAQNEYSDIPVQSQSVNSTRNSTSHKRGNELSDLIQDAYRLFEGPGSRLISANQ